MMNTKFLSMETLFDSLGYNYKDMPESSEVDISEKNVYIKSFDHEKGIICKNKILRLVRKKDSKVFRLKSKSGDVLLTSTNVHKVYDPSVNNYISVLEAKKVLLENGKEIDVICEESDYTSPILDMEVENTQNYFSNGILSHNTSGGKAIEFYSSIRNRVSKVEILKDKDGTAIGQRLKVVNKKNKTGIPFKEIEIDLFYNKGIDTFGEAIELGIKYGLIEKKGGWFNYPSFPDDKPIQGKDNVIAWFRENEKEYSNLRNQVLEHFNSSKDKGQATCSPIQPKEEVEKKRTRKKEKEENDNNTNS